MDEVVDDFGAYRQADVRFHIGLAEATGSIPRLVAVTTDAQRGHDRPDRATSRTRPRSSATPTTSTHGSCLRCAAATRRAVTQLMADHLLGTEHVLAGLLPGDPRPLPLCGRSVEPD